MGTPETVDEIDAELQRLNQLYNDIDLDIAGWSLLYIAKTVREVLPGAAVVRCELTSPGNYLTPIGYYTADGTQILEAEVLPAEWDADAWEVDLDNVIQGCCANLYEVNVKAWEEWTIKGRVWTNDSHADLDIAKILETRPI